jgi:hypothetical protein
VFGALLGTGLPPAPTYIPVAIVIAPPMTRVGVNPRVVHYFAFFLDVWSDSHPADFAGRRGHRRDRQCIILFDAQPRAADLCFAVHADGWRVRASQAGDQPGTDQFVAALLILVATIGITFASKPSSPTVARSMFWFGSCPRHLLSLFCCAPMNLSRQRDV